MSSSLFLFLTASVLLFLFLISNDSSYADSSGSTFSVTFDSYPRISPIVIDGIIYLPSQQPVSLSWKNDSTVHTFGIPDVSVYETSGKRYAFETWNDLDKNNIRSIKAKEIKNTQFLALFKTQYLLTVISDYGTTKGGGWYSMGEIAEFTLEDSAVQLSEDNRLVFDGWSAGFLPESMKNHIEIKGPTVVVASWKEQFRVNVASDIGHVRGSGWYDKGSLATIMVDDTEVEAEEKELKFVFEQWQVANGLSIVQTVKSEPSIILKVDGPHTIEAQWDKMYFVAIDSEYGNQSGQGYYRENQQAKLAVETTYETYETVPGNTRQAFAGWQEIKNDEGQGSNPSGIDTRNVLNILVNKPRVFKVLWTEQHFIDVKSEYGKTSGTGWYDVGSSAKIFLIEPSATLNLGFGKYAVFKGWMLVPSSTDSQSYSEFSPYKSGIPASYVIENINQPYKLEAVWTLDETWRYITIFAAISTSIAILWIFMRMSKRTSLNTARIGRTNRRDDLIAMHKNDIGIGESNHRQSLQSRSA